MLLTSLRSVLCVLFMSSVHLFSKLLTCGLLSAGLLLSSQLSNAANMGTSIRIPSLLLDRSQIQQISRLIGNLPKSATPSFANPSAIFTPPHLRVNNNPTKSSRFKDTRNQDCLIGAIKAQEAGSLSAHTSAIHEVPSSDQDANSARDVAATTTPTAPTTSSTEAVQGKAVTTSVPADSATATSATPATPAETSEATPAHDTEVVASSTGTAKTGKVSLASAKKATVQGAETAQGVAQTNSLGAATQVTNSDSHPTVQDTTQATTQDSTAGHTTAVNNLTLEPCELLFPTNVTTSDVGGVPVHPFEENEQALPFVHEDSKASESSHQDIYETFALAGDEAVVQFNFEKGVDLYGGIHYPLSARDKLIDQAQEQVINTGDMLVGSIYQLQQQLIATSPFFYFLTKSQVRLESYLSAISSYFRLHNQMYEVTPLTVPAQELELLLETIELPDVAAGILKGTYHHQPLEDFKVKLDTAIVEYFRHVDNKQEFANNLAATCNQQPNDLEKVVCKVDYLSLILASQEISSRYTPVANTLLAYNDLLDRLWYDPSLFDNQLIQQRIKAYSEFMRLLATQKSNDWYAQASAKLEETQGIYRKGLVQVYQLAVAGGINPVEISYLNREQPLAQH